MSAKIEFARRLLELLWNDYAERIPYARTYQNMLSELNGTFVNDHIAYRSLAVTAPDGTYLGITNIKRIFDALDFQEKGAIEFPKTKLFARYVQHDNPDFPRIFISELKVDELPDDVAGLIQNAVSKNKQVLTDADVKQIAALKDDDDIPEDLLQKTYLFFKTIPWGSVSESTIKTVNDASQYGAWTLLHGSNVNHFTGYINRHGVDGINDIDGLVAELKKRGVPMKDTIEGAPGTKLRQTSTQAVREPVTVIGEDGQEKQIEWTYAYMEYAQRSEIETEDGRKELFQGFLGPQASQLFEMTKLK